MGLNAALQVEYPSLEEIGLRPPAWWQDVLALIHFDGTLTDAALAALPVPASPAADGIPVARIRTPTLGNLRGAAEVWRLTGPMRSGACGRVRYRHNGRLLFASLSLSEAEFADPRAPNAAQALRDATDAGYRELFRTLERLQFPHPLRIWNFLPAINEESGGGGERYWHFNGARQDVFLGLNRSIAGNVPAASAVGADAATPLTIYCIAGASAPIPLENPRQLSAWNYPRAYGPRSPTFARACIEDIEAPTLFISGTASIVGHRTAHEGDPREQTRETLRNIRSLIETANRRLGCRRFSLDDLLYKVYVRRAEHQPVVERELRATIGPRPRAIYLKADICRRDLLVEIEAVGASSGMVESDE
jgi:enamine deaminase RidA (YjgF/YER057c/UK114 family)